MSFTSTESVVVPFPIEDCSATLSNVDTFIDFMSLSDITRDVEITSVDRVHLTPDLKIEEETPDIDAEDELCRRINFKLNELVTYVGVASKIPVMGNIIISSARRLHIEHREAMGGKVITDKVRSFEDCSKTVVSKATATETQEHQQDTSREHVLTKITEDIKGQTSWYLKYFVELEARRSHKATMSQYAAFLKRQSITQ